MKKVSFLVFSVIGIFFGNDQGALGAADYGIEVETLKQQVVSALPSLHGWCSKEKALAFIDLILTEKPTVWVEIGVFGGSSLFPVASTFKFLDEGKIFAIDAWDKIECIRYYDPVKDRTDLNWWGNLDLNQLYLDYLKVLKSHALEPYCITIRDTSERAAKSVDTMIDVLYIDGNHSEMISLQDVQLYFPKVRSGGFVWMNDATWEERQEAIHLLIKSCDVIKIIDNGNCILFKKR